MLGCYWLRVYPSVRGELAHWRRRAAAIPDPELRLHATQTLAQEHANAEGAAIFAVLAPRMHRVAVIRLLVGYQVLYDYLDTLTELPSPDPLRNSRTLHRALLAALGASAPLDWFACASHAADDGYLDELVATCSAAFASLPSRTVVSFRVCAAAARSAEGQSRNHAALRAGWRQLAGWSQRIAPHGCGLWWWEVAAAAGSSLAIHALLAAAAEPALTTREADRIAAAFWPWIGALNTLLESLVDREEDLRTGNHSYVAHYADPELAARRLGMLVAHAGAAVRELPHSERHAAILAGMTSFYLVAPTAAAPEARVVTRAVRQRLDVELGLLLGVLRLRRRLRRSA